MVKGITESGFEFELDEEILDDYELLESLCDIDNGDACGGVLGVAGLYTMPDFPAGDVINAVAVGMASGLAATGVNQLYKQQCK